jgi:ribonuclease HII
MSSTTAGQKATGKASAMANAKTTAKASARGSAAGGTKGKASAAGGTKGKAAIDPEPDFSIEAQLCAPGHRLIGGCDEVGRGALAGPVSVGLVVVDPGTTPLLPRVRDSKLLSVQLREELAPAIREWALAWGVGHASAQEIDDLGLVPALRLAGMRAWDMLAAEHRPHAVLLDGNLNWLGPARQDALFPAAAPANAAADAVDAEAALFPAPPAANAPSNAVGPGAGLFPPAPRAAAHDGGVAPAVVVPPQPAGLDIPITTRIKADMQCLSVAAASVLAKVERDALMATYDEQDPRYGWAGNKGYGTAAHRQAIIEHGPCRLHRRSWRLTGPVRAE